MDEERGQMTVREAGKRGGAARKAQLSPDGYSELGKKGGAATQARHGADHYSRIGNRGGAACRLKDPRLRYQRDEEDTVPTDTGERVKDPRERHGGSR